MKNSICILLFALIVPLLLFSQNSDTSLRFNRQGEFKIAQFTDIHWDDKSPNCTKTIEVIKNVLNTEQPDIAILTGDVVVEEPIKEGWMSIAKIFEEAKIPWAITLGNHDAETSRGYSRRDIFDLVDGLPYFIGEKGEKMTGAGNHTLPVLASKENSIAAILYCIDSNDYPTNANFGHYDWIHFDQIAWYRNLSDRYTQQNNNTPLPSLAFFHIALPEYKNLISKKTAYGTQNEGGSSPSINSGMFSSMLEKGDVMGTLVGHDHDNDFIGIENNIALAYGRVSGLDAYGDLERGARIVLMYENDRKFDTWIRTNAGIVQKYYYPSGISSTEEETMKYLPAQNMKVKEHGVDYKYYEKRFRTVDDIEIEKVIKTGVEKNITIASAQVQDSFAFVFQTIIDIPERGVYQFYTFSDDGSKLLIDDELVVDNDGSHSERRVNGKVALEKGLHRMKILYFESYMGERLEMGISSRNIKECLIPDEMLYLPPKKK